MADAPWTSLKKLIGSQSVERFFSLYWERQCFLVLSAQNPGLRTVIRALFSFDQTDRILSVHGPRFRDFIRMSKGGNQLPREEYSVVRQDGLVDFQIDRIIEFYRDGATLTLNRAHQCNDELAALCEDLSREFRAHVNANVYISPPNSQGFPVHSDTHDVFLLQVEGRKKWKIQRTLEYLSTPRNPNVISDPVAIDDWDEFYLNVGDAVYIPRGLLHEGIADGSHSLHITLGIHPYTWADVVRDALAEVESTDTLLRQSVTVSAVDLEKPLRTITSRLTTQLSNAASINSLVAARTRTYQAESYRGRFRDLTDPDRIILTTTVRTRIGLDIRLETNRDEVILHFGTKALAFPLFVSPHLKMILHSASVTAEQLPSDLDDDGKLTLLRRLLCEGVIEVEARRDDFIAR